MVLDIGFGWYILILNGIQPFEIGDELFHEISISQDGSRMIGDKKAILQDLAAQGCDALPACDGQCSRVSHQADDFRMENIDLSLQIGAALIYLSFLRFSVFRGAAFDDAGYEYL